MPSKFRLRLSSLSIPSLLTLGLYSGIIDCSALARQNLTTQEFVQHERRETLTKASAKHKDRSSSLFHHTHFPTLQSDFDYATQKVRGVNIGGWLVPEPWITPSLFQVGDSDMVDEYTLCQSLGKEEATRRLKAHWDSFYTEEDFHIIKSYGLNHVRIPLGFWALDISEGEPYVQGQYEYLLRAVGWCRNAGLKVLIDLHGAPGSQNGFDNSGRRGDITWDDDEENVNRAKDVLSQLTKEFSQPQYADVVAGIEALNEPAGFKGANMVNTLKKFYKDAYQIIRHSGNHAGDGPPTNLLYNIHDAFLPLRTWFNSFPEPSYKRVSLDTHIYTVFTVEGNRLNDQDRIQEYCSKIPSLVESQSKLWTFVGEFTPAPTDCAQHLNGVGRGARYDGSFAGSTKIGSCESKTGLSSQFSPEYKEALGKFFEIQTIVYERASGWFMWTFKAEKADDWSYDAGVKGGWIPKDLNKKIYGLSCH